MEQINDKEIQNIIQLISRNDILCIQAPTGSGKTTIIPAAFAKCKAKVYCVQPYEHSILSIYEYVSNKYKELKIGYFLNQNDNNIKEVHNIVYCTSSYIKKLFIEHYKSNKIDFCSILILDEIHSGSLDYDIILSLWFHLYSKEINIPKLVLSSAILNISYLPIDISDKTIVIDKKNNYSVFYHDKFFKLRDKKIMYDELLEKVIQFHNDVEINTFSTWILFFGDDKDIYYFINILKTIINSIDNLEFTTNPLSMNKKNIRKLLLTTNSLETSITINHVEGVFDSMLEKIKYLSNTGNYKLLTTNISKSSAIQRAGRTGRELEGFVYRMCNKEFYDTLNTFRISELNRISLTILFLELLQKKIDIKSVFKYRLDIDRIEQFMQELIKLKLCKYVDNELEIISKHKSDFIMKFRFLGIYSSIMLYSWIEKKLPIFPMIVFLSIIELEDSLIYNKKLNQKYDNIIPNYLNIWNMFSVKFKNLNPDRNLLKTWCSSNNIRFNTMNTLINKIKNYVDIFNKIVDFKLALFSVDNFMSNIMDILKSENILTYKKHKLRMFYVNEYNELFKLDQKFHYFNNMNTDYEDICVFNTISEIDSENRHTGRNYITMFLPLL